MNLRFAAVVVVLIGFLGVTGQEPSSRKQRPTLTNDDLRLEKAATLAAKQKVTGEEIISLLERTQSFRSHAVIDYMDWKIDVVPPDRWRRVSEHPYAGGEQAKLQFIGIRPYDYVSLDRIGKE